MKEKGMPDWEELDRMWEEIERRIEEALLKTKEANRRIEEALLETEEANRRSRSATRKFYIALGFAVASLLVTILAKILSFVCFVL